jgi:putative sporulation protein YyaC
LQILSAYITLTGFYLQRGIVMNQTSYLQDCPVKAMPAHSYCVDISYYDCQNSTSYLQLAEDFVHMLRQNDCEKRNLIFLCIGTDRATGDCLGPLVGSYLQGTISGSVYGTLADPVHALNIRQTIHRISQSYPKPLIVAVDAALGIPNHVGYVTLSNAPIAPGKGVNKKLPVIGDISITGIVNISGSNSHNLLQSTRLNTVMLQAECIAAGIQYASCHFEDF